MSDIAARLKAIAAGASAAAKRDPFGAGNLVAMPARVEVAPPSTLAAYTSGTDAEALQLPVTVFRGVRGRRENGLPEGSRVSANELRELIAPGSAPELVTEGLKRPDTDGTPLERVKKSGVRYVLPCSLAKGVGRSSDTATHAHWMSLDLDGVDDSSVERCISTLRNTGAWFLAHPTFSDGVKGDTSHGVRYLRIYLAFDRLVDKAEYAALSAAVALLLSVQHDPAQAKPEQLMGCWCAPAPQVLKAEGVTLAWPPKPKAWADGKALDVNKLLAYAAMLKADGNVAVRQPAAVAATTSAKILPINGDLTAGLHSGEPATLDRLQQALTWIDPNCAYEVWVRVGLALKAWGTEYDSHGARRLWLEWSDSAATERTAGNTGGNDPENKWSTFIPSMPAGAGGGVLCELAKEGAASAVRSARGAPSWPERALNAARYLGRHHQTAMAEFHSGEYPPVSPLDGSQGEKEDGGGALFALAQRLGRISLDQHGNPTLLGPLGPQGRTEALSLRDPRVFDAVLLAAVDAGAKRMPGKDTIAGVLSVFGAQARRAGNKTVVHRRIARTPAGVLLDVGNEQGEAIAVDATGVRLQAQSEHGQYFQRPDGYCPLPLPTPQDVGQVGVQASWRLLTEWLQGLGVAEREAPLVAVVLVRWLLPGGTFPILEIVGPAGQGKSTKTDLLASLIDPQPGGRAVSPIDLDERTVAAACSTACVVTLDNLSRVTPADSDTLCKLATGYRLSTRELHTTADVRHLDAHVRVIINGIAPVLTRGDALDRAIRVPMGLSRGALKSVEQVHEEFNAQHPALVGALCTLLSAALKHWSAAGPADHRLVEFVTVGRGVYLAMGRSPDEFSKAFREHRRDTAAYLSEGDPMLRTLLAAVEAMTKNAPSQTQFPKWTDWHQKPGYAAIQHPRVGIALIATPGVLLEQMKAHAPADLTQDWRDRNAIPRNARAMDHALMRVTPMMKALGWTIQKKELAAKRSAWAIYQPGDSE
ncbi:MAG: PriCT-2 domain-containing protein [Pseudomonadota bacterium]